MPYQRAWFSHRSILSSSCRSFQQIGRVSVMSSLSTSDILNPGNAHDLEASAEDNPSNSFLGWQNDLDLQLRVEGDGADSSHDAQISNEEEVQPLLRDARFASKELLCPWFPEADPSHKRAQTLGKRLSQRQAVLTTACCTAWLVLIVNLISTIYLPIRHPDARLFVGNCTTASRLDSGLHVLINLLSSLLLGASNLCMQLLSAPTRKEVDKAHQQKKWLEIGIPSMLQNFKYIATRRKLALIVLALASLPLHFL